MPTPKHVEYMLFPRLAALSEVAWSNRAKNWPHFKTKMNTMLKRYDQLDINYAKSSLLPNIQFNFDTTTQQFSVELSSELQSEIYYTLNGEEPNVTSSTKYTEPFILDHSATIKAMATKDGVPIGLPEKKEAILHKAIGCEVDLNAKASKKYAAKGGFTLVDGDFGGDKWGNGKWLGILNQDLEATITLSKDTTISKVALSCIEETSAGIYLPSALIVEVSEDGKTYTELGKWKTSREHPIPLSPNIKTEKISVSFTPTTCRFVRVKALYQRVKNRGVFIFADELIVE